MLHRAGAVSAPDGYLLSVFIKDQPKYELSKTAGVIIDPLSIVIQSGGGSNGGCSAGFAGALILPALPFIAKKDLKSGVDL